MEEIRSSHMREVASLTEACRRAESSRREAIGRLEPVRNREGDMTGTLHRLHLILDAPDKCYRFPPVAVSTVLQGIEP